MSTSEIQPVSPDGKSQPETIENVEISASGNIEVELTQEEVRTTAIQLVESRVLTVLGILE